MRMLRRHPVTAWPTSTIEASGATTAVKVEDACRGSDIQLWAQAPATSYPALQNSQTASQARFRQSHNTHFSVVYETSIKMTMKKRATQACQNSRFRPGKSPNISFLMSAKPCWGFATRDTSPARRYTVQGLQLPLQPATLWIICSVGKRRGGTAELHLLTAMSVSSPPDVVFCFPRNHRPCLPELSTFS
jgi:hypothetical protein